MSNRKRLVVFVPGDYPVAYVSADLIRETTNSSWLVIEGNQAYSLPPERWGSAPARVKRAVKALEGREE